MREIYSLKRIDDSLGGQMPANDRFALARHGARIRIDQRHLPIGRRFHAHLQNPQPSHLLLKRCDALP